MRQFDRVQSFEDLAVHKKAHSLALHVIRATFNFPPEHRFGITGQLQRAVASVPANIAEGWERGPGNANANHVRTARGSLAEVQSFLALCRDLEFLTLEVHASLIQELIDARRLLDGYLRSIESNLTREEMVAYGPSILQAPDS